MAKIKRKAGWEFYQDRKKKWRWRLVAKNGRIVAAASQGYARRRDCRDNIGQFVDQVLLASWDQVPSAGRRTTKNHQNQSPERARSL